MYNAEKFIEQCLGSVRNQTFTDYEVIVVDDHSTDRSVEIVESLALKFDGRLRLIRREENSGGAAIPRNEAMKIARGDYITFLDNDDLLTRDALQKLFDAAIEHDADVVHAEKHYSTAADVIDSGTKLAIVFNPKMPVDAPRRESDDLAERIREYRQNIFFGNWVVWHKLFRRQFIEDNHIEFPDLRVADDMMFSFFCLCLSKTYVRIPDAVCVYRVRRDSFSRDAHSVEEYFRKWTMLIIDGVKILDDFMSGIEFFARNVEQKYAVFDLFVGFHFDHYLSRVYAGRKISEFDRILREELSRGGNAALSAYLFGLSNAQRLQLKENRSVAKKTLRSWDVFDTLIARRCIFPTRIFSMVEQRSKVKGFATLRLNAERFIQARGVEYTLDTIYDVMRQKTRLDPKIVERLKKLELEIEFEQAIPIVENLSRVQSGDVLITDMYLTAEKIRRLLKKCGLQVPVEIVVSNNGKSSGKIWRQFRDQGVHLFHTGDNQQSDVLKPREFQFDSAWTVLSRPTALENQLMKIDFDFAAYLRELRLAAPYRDELKRIYWTTFVLNVGCLMLMAQLIDAAQKHYGFEYLGFCGRDTYYLREIYRRLKDDRHEEAPSNDYLYYSRKLIANSGDELGKYFGRAIGGRRALLIDLTGTGVHMRVMRDKYKLMHAFLIFVMFNPNVAAKIYPQYKQYLPIDWRDIRAELMKPSAVDRTIDQTIDRSNEAPEYFYVFERQRDGITDVDELERFNRATHNSPIRMKTIDLGGRLIPEVTFSEVDDSEGLEIFEACMEKIMSTEIRWSRLGSVEELTSALKTLLIAFDEQARRLRFVGQHDVQEAADHMSSV